MKVLFFMIASNLGVSVERNSTVVSNMKVGLKHFIFLKGKQIILLAINHYVERIYSYTN
jgi:hypothetical protein